MNFDIKSGLSNLTLSLLILAAISSPALAQQAQNNHTYPLDIELLDSTSVVNNLRQRATVEHMIVNVGHVGHSDAGLDPQPEMIIPTAKSPTIQEWPSQSTKIYASHPIISHQAATKTQPVWHQSIEAAVKSKPVPIASAYPFNTGSNSYTIGGKYADHHRSEYK